VRARPSARQCLFWFKAWASVDAAGNRLRACVPLAKPVPPIPYVSEERVESGRRAKLFVASLPCLVNDIYIVNVAIDTVVMGANADIDRVNSAATSPSGANVENLTLRGRPYDVHASSQPRNRANGAMLSTFRSGHSFRWCGAKLARNEPGVPRGQCFEAGATHAAAALAFVQIREARRRFQALHVNACTCASYAPRRV
jgi:hypothetical protein